MNRYGIALKNGDNHIIVSDLDINQLMEELTKNEWAALRLEYPCKWQDEGKEPVSFLAVMVSVKDVTAICFIESED